MCSCEYVRSSSSHVVQQLEKITLHMYRTVKNFGSEKTLANLANYSNSPSFLPIFCRQSVLLYGIYWMIALWKSCYKVSHDNNVYNYTYDIVLRQHQVCLLSTQACSVQVSWVTCGSVLGSQNLHEQQKWIGSCAQTTACCSINLHATHSTWMQVNITLSSSVTIVIPTY